MGKIVVSEISNATVTIIAGRQVPTLNRTELVTFYDNISQLAGISCKYYASLLTYHYIIKCSYDKM
jgi:hypothetical protein